MIELASWVSFLSCVVAGAAAGLSIATAKRYRREVRELHDTALVSLELLELMEQAQDPGRDVHARLARAFEATLVRGPEAGDRPDPAARRVAAMALAADFIAIAGRANIRLVTGEEETDG